MYIPPRGNWASDKSAVSRPSAPPVRPRVVSTTEKKVESGGLSACEIYEKMSHRTPNGTFEEFRYKSLKATLPSGAVFEGGITSPDSQLTDSAPASFTPPAWASKSTRLVSDQSKPNPGFNAEMDLDRGLVFLTKGEARQTIYPDGSTEVRSGGYLLQSDAEGHVSAFKEVETTGRPFGGGYKPWTPPTTTKLTLVGRPAHDLICPTNVRKWEKSVDFTTMPEGSGVTIPDGLKSTALGRVLGSLPEPLADKLGISSNLQDHSVEWILAPEFLIARKSG